MQKLAMRPLVWVLCGLVFLAVGFFWGQRQTSAAGLTEPNSPNQNKNSSSQPTSQTTPSLTVEAITPTPTTISQTIQASGSIVGKELAQVGTKVSGVAIEQILVEVGDVVKAGQVLAILDDTHAQETLAEHEASVAAAEANLQKAANDLARVEPLMGIDAISREQFDGYQNAKIQAEAQYQMAKARLHHAQTSKHNTQVIAPVSGIISTKTAQIGQMTTGGVLFEIVKDGVLEWQATVSPAIASQINIGQMGELQIGENSIQVRAARISPTTNNARELIVHADIAPNPLLRSGMYQSGVFIFGEMTAPTLPVRTVTTTDGKSYVWTLQGQAGVYKANKTQIQTGQIQGDTVVVDLPADTLVVKQGGNFLKDGDWVRLAAGN